MERNLKSWGKEIQLEYIKHTPLPVSRKLYAFHVLIIKMINITAPNTIRKYFITCESTSLFATGEAWLKLINMGGVSLDPISSMFKVYILRQLWDSTFHRFK